MYIYKYIYIYIIYIYIYIYIYIFIYLETTENGYIGCWKDGVSNRLLRHQIGRGVRNIQDCAVRCLGYTYFGMEVKAVK